MPAIMSRPPKCTVHSPVAAPPAVDNDLENMLLDVDPNMKFEEIGAELLQHFFEKGLRSLSAATRKSIKCWLNRNQYKD